MTINAKRIEVLLGARNLTKSEFSQHCGVSRQTLSTIVRRGTCEPRTACKIARALGVTVEYLTQED